MIHVRFDSKEINRKLNNAVSFSYGFLDGIDMDQILFNKSLALFTEQALNKYIDSQARMNPEKLHHVYEWNEVGNESARLFVIKSAASKRVIHFYGTFLKSSSTPPTSNDPFVNKAEVMESGISITVEPKNSDVLVFENEGETIFTRNAIHVEHPGGDEVANSFGQTIDEFFSGYFTNALLAPFISSLSNPKEFAAMFPSGVRGGGRPTGIKAGKQYLKMEGITIQ